MKFTLTIPDGLPAMTVKELLEEQFLIPRKIRSFSADQEALSVNGLSINWQTVVKPGDDIRLIFDEEDYPQKTILFGNGELVEELYQDQHLIIVNKPEGMKTHAMNQQSSPCLIMFLPMSVRPAMSFTGWIKKPAALSSLPRTPFVPPIPQSAAGKARNQAAHIGLWFKASLPS